MYVDVPVVEDTIVHAERVDVSLYVFEGDNCRLLHHVTEVSGQCQLASLALAQRSLDEENLSTYACPSQTRHYTGIVVALIDVAIEWRFAEQVLYLVGSDLLVWEHVVESLLVCELAQSLVHLLLELSYTALSCVLLYYLLNGSLCECRLVLLGCKAAVVNLTRDEMALGYLYLLLGDVSAHLYQLHTVEQWTRNGSEVVGCGDEEHLGEVEVHVQIVVVEGVVLFWVEHLKQSRRRVAVDGVLRHLVNLVKNEYGIS